MKEKEEKCKESEIEESYLTQMNESQYWDYTDIIN